MGNYINSISWRFHLEMEKKWHKDNEVLKFRILHLIKEHVGLFYFLYQVQFSRTLRLFFSELFVKGSVTHPTYHMGLRDSSHGNESDHSMRRTNYLTSIAKIKYAKMFLLMTFITNHKGMTFFTFVIPTEFHYTLSEIHGTLQNSGLLSPNTPYQLL